MEEWGRWPTEPAYEVSTWGRVRSAKMGRLRILKPDRHTRGYQQLTLIVGVKRAKAYIHRMVLETFDGPCPPDMECRHLDGDRTNNRLTNLMWGTKRENLDDRIRHGTFVPWQPPEPNKEIVFSDPFVPSASLYITEVWAEIPGSDGYQASNLGRVRSPHVNYRSEVIEDGWTILKPQNSPYGHKYVRVFYSGKYRARGIHRYVVEAFKGPCPPGMECLHIDGDASNNRLDNLRWGTPTENQNDRLRHGTSNRGSKSAAAKLTEEDVREILAASAAGERGCLIAKRFGIASQTVCNIIKGRRWPSVHEALQG
jgi:hypothetical protein